MTARAQILKRLEGLGHWFFFMALRIFGYRGGSFLLGPVIFVYVFFSRKIQRTVKYYLERRFPGKSGWKYWLYTYRNLYSFGHVLVDRGWLGIKDNAGFVSDFSGYDTLIELIERKKGVVLLTAHVGNWQSALAHLGSLPVKVHALMQYDQQAAAKHYFDINNRGRSFEIIDAEGPFGGMVDASAALQRGEVVTIMGDRFIKGSFSNVDFLGESVRVPDAAYLLAATTGAPVIILLAAKTGKKAFQLKIWDYFYPQYANREERGQMLQECAQKYITAVEEYLKIYPFQWYNYYNFWKQ